MNAFWTAIFVIVALAVIGIFIWLRYSRRKAVRVCFKGKEDECQRVLTEAMLCLSRCETARTELKARVSAPELKVFLNMLRIAHEEATRASDMLRATSESSERLLDSSVPTEALGGFGGDWDRTLQFVQAAEDLAREAGKEKGRIVALEALACSRLQTLAEEIIRADEALGSEESYGFKLSTIRGLLDEVKAADRQIRAHEFANHELAAVIGSCEEEVRKLKNVIMPQLDHIFLLRQEAELRSGIGETGRCRDEIKQRWLELSHDQILKIAFRHDHASLRGNLTDAGRILAESEAVFTACRAALESHDLEGGKTLLEKLRIKLGAIEAALAPVREYRYPNPTCDSAQRAYR